MPSLPVSSVFPEFETADPTKARVDFSKFPSRRSVVHSTNGLVACSQPLAAKCGVEILEKGGNAAVSCPHNPDENLAADTCRTRPWPSV